MAKKGRRNDDDDDDYNNDDAPAGLKADAYVGLGVITLMLLLAGGVLFYLDTDALGTAKTTGPSVQVNAIITPPAATK
ncbi:MAG TPA: hypothetical protein VGJ05_04285 [Fimbriiglobus sp.]